MKKAGFLLAMAGLVLSVSCAAMAGQGGVITALVVPAKYAVVQLALDVAQLKGVQVIVYDQPKKATEPVLNVWNSASRSWSKSTLAAYGSGETLSALPQTVILIGSDEVMLSRVEKAAAWGSASFKRVQLSTVVNMLNGINETVPFNNHDWVQLAQWHKLTLKDLNKDRRRYGRWGKPGEGTPAPVPAGAESESSGVQVPVVMPGTAVEVPVSPAPVPEVAPVVLPSEPATVPVEATPVVNPADK